MTNTEKNITEQYLYRDKVRNGIIGFGIKDRFDELLDMPGHSDEKYLLYAGRIEAAEGVMTCNCFRSIFGKIAA